jgi:hypothetical protein
MNPVNVSVRECQLPLKCHVRSYCESLPARVCTTLVTIERGSYPFVYDPPQLNIGQRTAIILSHEAKIAHGPMSDAWIDLAEGVQQVLINTLFNMFHQSV